jgi:hypothetical protein
VKTEHKCWCDLNEEWKGSWSKHGQQQAGGEARMEARKRKKRKRKKMNWDSPE